MFGFIKMKTDHQDMIIRYKIDEGISIIVLLLVHHVRIAKILTLI